jgi:FtsH-binding integral membrane protein
MKKKWLSVLFIFCFTINGMAQSDTNKSTTNFLHNNRPILWFCIGAALVILLFLTKRLTKAIDKKKENDHL